MNELLVINILKLLYISHTLVSEFSVVVFKVLVFD